jgi:N-acetyl-gamma-glutamyl-phosphate reductase
MLKLCGGKNKKIFFVPQVIPASRGILNNIYFDVKEGYNTKKVHELYVEYYKNKPFVRVTESSPNSSDVIGSNLCEIRALVDDRTGKMLVTSVIDNLLKGQSGNAVQNANIMMGYDETSGIQRIPFYP